MNKYKIILSDNTEINNLGLNGNNYISSVEIDGSIFVDNLDTVTIIGGGETVILHNCKLTHLTQYGNEWWFGIDEMTELDQVLKEHADALIELAEMITEG